MFVFTRSLIYTFFLFTTFNSLAAHEPFPIGARAAGLAGAAITLSDVWSIRNNVAGIASLKKSEIGIFAENRFNVAAFTTAGLQFAFPINKNSGLGIDLSRFGDQWYNEQRFGIGFGHRLGTVNIGIKADILQTHMEEVGSKRAVAISLGGQSEVIPHLIFAASIFNINQAKLAKYMDERLPTMMRAGLSYQPISSVLLVAEAEKHLDYPVNVKVGLEYKLIAKLNLRAGIASATEQFSFGTGFQAKQLHIDYAYGRQSILGNLHQIAISYKWN